MHCGFLSYSLVYLTHIVALDTFTVLLSYLMLETTYFKKNSLVKCLFGPSYIK